MDLKLLALTFKTVLFLLLINFTNIANAQYVTIPDTRVVNYFQKQFPSCMKGNQMDTTCPAILITKSLGFTGPGIASLDGIQYFDSLEILNLNYLQVSSLPRLPSRLISLGCLENYKLSVLPTLPKTLTSLYCTLDSLIELPDLPVSLEELACNQNYITKLPKLPAGLTTLRCSNNELTEIPNIPDSLEVLTCSYNKIKRLPPLAIKVKYLFVDHNLLDSLPAFPVSLRQLECQNNLLNSLPEVKACSTMFYINCSGNKLKHLPALPLLLNNIDCDTNRLDSLPDMPSRLRTLSCKNNELTLLPVIPLTLTFLDCSQNKILELPDLPVSNVYSSELYCSNNLLSKLPPLPMNLWMLYCNNNQLTELPALTMMPYNLDCSHNKITCFNPFPDNSNYGNPMIDLSDNPFKCLPNYRNGMDALSLAMPLCAYDESGPGNPYGCPVAVGITGKVYNDSNINCAYDAGEALLSNFSIVLKDKKNVFVGRQLTLKNGSYAFNPSQDIYKLQIDTVDLPVSLKCKYPGADTLIKLDAKNPLVKDINFGISCYSEFDLGIKYISPVGRVFPGQIHTVYLDAGDLSQNYGLSCASGIGGSVSVDISGKVKYIGPANLSLKPDTIKGNHFVYTIKDFGKTDLKKAFGLVLKVDTNANISDEICIDVIITPFKGDRNIKNNKHKHCYNIRNSHDPNLKEVYPVNVPENYSDWLTYTIHFQNTGTAPAYNIRLADTLDNNLDPETFTLLGQSHDAEVNQKGRILSFRFKDIMLPDSHVNEQKSHGYLQYKVRPKNAMTLGSKISNTAFIYFDYNDAVITNTTVNGVVKNNVSISRKSLQSIIQTYPNPGSGIIKIECKKDFVLIINDITGKQIGTYENIKEINLPPGIFLFEYYSDGNRIVEKIVVY